MTPRPGDTHPPFLDADPPPLAARGLAYLLLALFATGCLASVALHLPETVSGRFVLAAERGTDAIRALREGVVADVRAAEGDTVGAGATLYVIRSQGVGDRSTELSALRARLAATAASLTNAAGQRASQRRADSAEVARLEGRAAYLERLIPMKRAQLALAHELAAGLLKGRQDGAVTAHEHAVAQRDADRLTEEVEATQRELADTRILLGKLPAEIAVREAQFAEVVRDLGSARDEATIRIAALEHDVLRGEGNAFRVVAPCAGSVVRLRVRAAGAVVQAGETLGVVACAGQRLRAEMTLPEDGVPFVRPGQGVKLLYDAFPYQRYGVRAGTVRWVGPAGARGDSTAFRALVDIDTAAVRARGRARPLVMGMGGRAEIVVGRRSLIGYVFEPIRQLRESLADAPERPAAPVRGS